MSEMQNIESQDNPQDTTQISNPLPNNIPRSIYKPSIPAPSLYKILTRYLDILSRQITYEAIEDGQVICNYPLGYRETQQYLVTLTSSVLRYS